MPGAPARNMADIAKMFLDGARPVGVSGTGRVPPAASSKQPTKPAATQRKAERGERGAVMLAFSLASHDPAAWRLMSNAAAGMAEEQSTTVALVGLQNETFVIDVFGAESAEDFPSLKLSNAAGAPDMQIARAMFTLRESVGLWMVAAPDPEHTTFRAIASVLREWVVACPTDNDGVLGAYQHLKKAWVKAGGGERTGGANPSVFLLDDDYAHAALVHKRLRAASQEFLKTDLQLAGVGPMHATAAARVFALPASGPMDVLWASVLDEVCPLEEETETPPQAVGNAADVEEQGGDLESALDKLASSADDVARNSAAAAHAMLDHLAQVLDPEEREALSAAFEDVEEPGPAVARPRHREATDEPARESFDIRTQVIPPVVIKVSASAPAAPVTPERIVDRPAVPSAAAVAPAMSAPVMQTAPVTAATEAPAAKDASGLRAFDAGKADRVEQWLGVERSIGDLLAGAVLMEARPPMSWAAESCIAIDKSGRLHIWALYKDGVSWFALREWASEHRDLLALTRRDLTVCKEAEVAVHVVLPLESAGVETSQSLLKAQARHVHVYRLHRLQWNGRWGLVVVPLA
jgi:hypothetical protein